MLEEEGVSNIRILINNIYPPSSCYAGGGVLILITISDGSLYLFII